MAGSDYVPQTDEGFRAWSTNFAAHMTSSYVTYGFTSAQAASIQAVVNDFVAKLLVIEDPARKTQTTVIDKDNARSIAEGMCRNFAMIIRNNLGIDDADKVAAGVRPINPDREPIGPPLTQPLLNIIVNLPGVQQVRFADATTPDSKKKPFGYANLQLFRGVGMEEPVPLAQSQFYGAFTKNPIDVDFAEGDDGKIATYYARWANSKGETGPWSLPISMRVAA